MISPETIARYRALFVVREDTFALQQPDGRYFRVPIPVSDLLIRAHLTGCITAGWYALNGGTCRWLCLDADTDQEWDGLRRLQALMATDGLAAHLEHSRRGGHLWVFFVEAVPAALVRRVALDYLDRLGLKLELFPKQDRARYGSLVRGPLGVHRLTGKRYDFAGGGNIEEQMATLWERRVRVERIEEQGQTVRVKDVRQVSPSRWRRAPRNGSPIARLNQVLDVWELAGQVTELDPGTGMGSCPLHPPDRHPSFAINREEGWWICFHGEDGTGRRPIGGDAFELYCRLNGIGHREGIARLAYLLD